MNDDLVKIITIILISIFVIYLIYQTFNINEGLTNLETVSAVQNTTNGIAGNASNYNAAIKAASVQLQDNLLISKYRTDYENAIINMDDYLSLLMLEQVLSMNTSGDKTTNITNLSNLNTIFTAKSALNQTMTYIDKQQ